MNVQEYTWIIFAMNQLIKQYTTPNIKKPLNIKILVKSIWLYERIWKNKNIISSMSPTSFKITWWINNIEINLNSTNTNNQNSNLILVCCIFWARNEKKKLKYQVIVLDLLNYISPYHSNNAHINVVNPNLIIFS